jgi:hypothetical protein
MCLRIFSWLRQLFPVRFRQDLGQNAALSDSDAAFLRLRRLARDHTSIGSEAFC